MNERVWLITGASSGFGRALAQAVLDRGDTVVAAVRDPAALDDMPGVSTVRLDVTEQARITSAVAETLDRHGRIDVLVNNAGRALFGAVEETTDAELRALMDLHFFGPAALVRAVLPHMRERGSGTIVQMSSMGGQLSFAGVGPYSATKAALEGLSEALAEEVAPHGIGVLIVEPGAFRTGLFGDRLAQAAETDPYAGTVGKARATALAADGRQPGDPAKAAAAILAALDGDTPLRLPLGNDAVDALTAHADSVRRELLAWEDVARGTDFD
ncbi:SDR family NAD(P)-dependent oxidoreductase [Actinomadura atramentaria]|uniref:SDR family NAD(P)-dependent oxidoreductase n=1 Tax=Actinomadura atramentaria TaxID=1990 RepID=UPI0006865876|nr:SDR family NAD(P)-dependent oxidoreductase [Actinomadura atramentaria]